MIKKIIRKIMRKIESKKYGHLGDGSRIKHPVTCTNRQYIYIGDRVTIEDNAYIEPIMVNIDNEGKSYPLHPKLEIQDGVWIGPGAHINCANSVIIHKDVLISSYVMITDLDHVYSDPFRPVSRQPLEVKSTEIDEQAFIGTGVKILAGVHIGKHAVIGANSVVNRDIPDYTVAVGIPAKIVKKYNKETGLWDKVQV